MTLFALLAGCGAKDGGDVKEPAAAPVADNGDGPGVTVKKDAQVRAGIEVAPLAAHAVQAELIAYGKLEEDPSESFTVRAPAAGSLQLARGQTWPSLGQTVAAGSGFGRIQPRLSTTDRIGLETQMATARAELNGSTAAVAAAQTAYDRARALNADNKNISDRAVQEAAARLAAEQAREAGARALIHTLQTSLADGTAGALAVVAGRGGEVAEVLAQPGESIEQGAAIVRLARFDRLLAHIDLPVGEHVPANDRSARIVPTGFEGQSALTGERIGVAAVSDPHTQGVSLLYRLTGSLPGLRPGMALTARFALPGSSGEGVVIPRSAIVQQNGNSWAYVQTKDDRFSRRALNLDLPTQAGFIVSRGFKPGDRVVIAGAQSLLSEEFKSQNEADSN